MLAITSDNAETNDKVMRELKLLEPTMRGTEGRVRCFAHVLNLVVKVRVRASYIPDGH